MKLDPGGRQSPALAVDVQEERKQGSPRQAKPGQAGSAGQGHGS
jgi:hypothetical protein